MRAVLQAEQIFDLAELRRLEAARRAEHAAKGQVIGRGQRREHVPAQRHHRLDAGDAGEILVDLDQLVGADQRTRQPQLVDGLLEPELLGLVDDDEQQLVMMIGDRVLGVEQLVERQILAVGHVAGVSHGDCVYHAHRIHKAAETSFRAFNDFETPPVRACGMAKGFGSCISVRLGAATIALLLGLLRRGRGRSAAGPARSGGEPRRPAFTSPATANAAENSGGTIYTATATDPDGNPLTFRLAGGADQRRLRDHRRRRALLRRSRPISRAPTDADTNNVYLVSSRSATARPARRSISPSPSPMSGRTASGSRRVGTGFVQPVYPRRRCRTASGRVLRRAAGRADPHPQSRDRRRSPPTPFLDVIDPDHDRRRARPARLRDRAGFRGDAAPSTSS